MHAKAMPSAPHPELTSQLAASKAVFFDLFHTLFSFKAERTAGQSTSALLGIPEARWDHLLFASSERRLRGLIHDRYEIIAELAHLYDPSIDEALIRKVADLRVERFTAGLQRVNPERIAVLRALRAAGKKIGLISNADSVEVSGWKASPLAACFDSVVFSFATGYVKPEPEIYKTALESLGVAPTESVFVGDGGSDELRGAKELGFTTVMTTEIIGPLWPEKIAGRRVHADHVVASLAALSACLAPTAPQA